MSQLTRLFVAILYLLLVACGGGVDTRDGPLPYPPDIADIPDAVPKKEPKSKYGNPEHYEVFGKRYYPLASSEGFREQGMASWYGRKFHGRRTSSGEIYDMYAMTAAHKTLPLPSYVEVSNLSNGKKVIVKVNDRGPFHDNRIIDLSYTAAKKLGMVSKGTTMVRIRAINNNSDNRVPSAPVTEPKITNNSGTPLVENNTKIAEPITLNTQIYIQVGAFANPVTAQQLKQQLQQKIGDTVLVVAPNQPAATLHRVQLGPLINTDYGDALLQRLAELGFHDAYMVIK